MAEKSKLVSQQISVAAAPTPVSSPVVPVNLPNPQDIVANAVAQAAVVPEKKPRKLRAAGNNQNNILVRMKAQRDEIEDLKKKLTEKDSSSQPEIQAPSKQSEDNSATQKSVNQEKKVSIQEPEKISKTTNGNALERSSEEMQQEKPRQKNVFIQNLRFHKKRF